MNLEREDRLCEGAMTAALLGLSVVMAGVLFVMGIVLALS